jgi:hypothetical protein
MFASSFGKVEKVPCDGWPGNREHVHRTRALGNNPLQSRVQWEGQNIKSQVNIEAPHPVATAATISPGLRNAVQW